jgi:hypothetical protein
MPDPARAAVRAIAGAPAFDPGPGVESRERRPHQVHPPKSPPKTNPAFNPSENAHSRHARGPLRGGPARRRKRAPPRTACACSEARRGPARGLYSIISHPSPHTLQSPPVPVLPMPVRNPFARLHPYRLHPCPRYRCPRDPARASAGRAAAVCCVACLPSLSRRSGSRPALAHSSAAAPSARTAAQRALTVPAHAPSPVNAQATSFLEPPKQLVSGLLMSSGQRGAPPQRGRGTARGIQAGWVGGGAAAGPLERCGRLAPACWGARRMRGATVATHWGGGFPGSGDKPRAGRGGPRLPAARGGAAGRGPRPRAAPGGARRGRGGPR